MGLQRGLQAHHAAAFHHGTDGRHFRLVNLGGIGHGNNLDGGSLLELVKLVLQYVKAHFQVFGVHNVKERDAGRGGAVKGGVQTAHGAADGRGDGAALQFMLQELQGGQGRVVAAVDAGLPFDFVGGLVQLASLVSLAHQDGLVLVFGLFQLGLAPGNLVFQHAPAQAHHHLSLANPLAQLDVEGHNLLADTAVHRHFRDGLDAALAGEALAFNGALEALVPVIRSLLHRYSGFLGRRRGRYAGVARYQCQKNKEGKVPIHAA